MIAVCQRFSFHSEQGLGFRRLAGRVQQADRSNNYNKPADNMGGHMLVESATIKGYVPAEHPLAKQVGRILQTYDGSHLTRSSSSRAPQSWDLLSTLGAHAQDSSSKSKRLGKLGEVRVENPNQTSPKVMY